MFLFRFVTSQFVLLEACEAVVAQTVPLMFPGSKWWKATAGSAAVVIVHCAFLPQAGRGVVWSGAPHPSALLDGRRGHSHALCPLPACSVKHPFKSSSSRESIPTP